MKVIQFTHPDHIGLNPDLYHYVTYLCTDCETFVENSVLDGDIPPKVAYCPICMVHSAKIDPEARRRRLRKYSTSEIVEELRRRGEIDE